MAESAHPETLLDLSEAFSSSWNVMRAARGGEVSV